MIVFDCSSPMTPLPVASFNLSADGDGYFADDRRHLERHDTFSLDPRHLPLHEEKILLPLQPDGTFGVLSDAGPDAWGTRLTRSTYSVPAAIWEAFDRKPLSSTKDGNTSQNSIGLTTCSMSPLRNMQRCG